MMALTPAGERLSFRKPTPISMTCGKRIIAKRLYAAKTLPQQGLGLIGRSLEPAEALLFLMERQRFSLHMWFVFHPIDVLFCDHSGEGLVVKEIKRGFSPFTTYRAHKASDLFIELRAGATKGLRTGDRIAFSRKIFKAQRRFKKR